MEREREGGGRRHRGEGERDRVMGKRAESWGEWERGRERNRGRPGGSNERSSTQRSMQHAFFKAKEQLHNPDPAVRISSHLLSLAFPPLLLPFHLIPFFSLIKTTDSIEKIPGLLRHNSNQILRRQTVQEALSEVDSLFYTSLHSSIEAFL